jgi:hypothetical protein
MDDYNITSLQESNNEWVSRLISILTPCIVNGCNSIYQEAYKLCNENEEEEKYLMTFQNFLSRVPKWNEEIVNAEVEKIKKDSGCDYLEDLITCVHVIQLKALTCIRVGMKHKAIDIDIPKLGNFIHKIYILLARKLYTNVYLYEENIPPLDVQRNNRELEVLIRECIMESVRDSIPVESILRAYLDETVEENVETVISTEKVSEEDNANNLSQNTITEPQPKDSENSENSENSKNAALTSDNSSELVPTMVNVDSLISGSPASLVEATTRDLDSITTPQKQLSFSNIDETQNTDNTRENIVAPKDVATLEKISDENHARRMLEEAEGDDDEESLKISNEDANIQLDIETL